MADIAIFVVGFLAGWVVFTIRGRSLAERAAEDALELARAAASRLGELGHTTEARVFHHKAARLEGRNAR